MLRYLYRCALSLHPAAFRRRFADEMLSIFDHASGTSAALKLFLDSLLSLLRQWMLRSEFWHDATSAAAPEAASNGIPSFYTISPFRPRGAAFLYGLVLSFAVFCVTCFAIRYSWIHVLHVRIPEVQFERPSWTPPSPTTSDMSQSAQKPPVPPQRDNKPRSAAVSAPATPQASAVVAAVSRRRSGRILKEANPAKPQMSNQPLAAQAEIEPPLHVYDGTYAVDAPAKLTIVITTDPDDESLRMSLSGQPRLALTPLSETKFAVQGIDNCWIEFVPGPTPGFPMRQLHFSCNGQEYVGHRR